MQQLYLVVICLLTLTKYICATPNKHFLPLMQLISGTLKEIESQSYKTMMVEEFHRYLLMLSEVLQQAERGISNEQQLEQDYRNYYESHHLHFAEVVKKMENEALLNEKLRADVAFYRDQTQVAMRNEARAVKQLEQYGIRGFLKKCRKQMPEQLKAKYRHKIRKLALLS